MNKMAVTCGYSGNTDDKLHNLEVHCSSLKSLAGRFLYRLGWSVIFLPGEASSKEHVCSFPYEVLCCPIMFAIQGR